MTDQIARDTARTVKSGLDVYDRDGHEVGFVEQASDAQGWMQVEVVHLGLHRLWIPERLVRGADNQKVVLTVARDELGGYADPPARETEVAHREGRAVAITRQANGRDGAPVVTSDVDVNDVRSHVAIGQHVWTADGQELGTIKEFDGSLSYAVLESGALSRKRDLLVPVHLIADVNRDEGTVKLAVRMADLDRMRRLESVNVIVDLPAYLVD